MCSHLLCFPWHSCPKQGHYLVPGCLLHRTPFEVEYFSQTKSMGVVEHRCDTIKTEAIKLVLIYPPTQIGQQESENLPAVDRNGSTDITQGTDVLTASAHHITKRYSQQSAHHITKMYSQQSAHHITKRYSQWSAHHITQRYPK